MAAELVPYGQRISMGNKAAWIGYVVMSGLVSGAVQLLGKIECGFVQARSGDADTSFSVDFNKASGATAIDGYLDIRSGIDGDYYNVIVIGQP